MNDIEDALAELNYHRMTPAEAGRQTGLAAGRLEDIRHEETAHATPQD